MSTRRERGDPRIGEILRTLDPPVGARLWHGGASPAGALRGVAAREAAWKPHADRHSIWELVLHMAYWKYTIRRHVAGSARGGFPRSPANWPAVPEAADDTNWERDKVLLRDEHRALVAAIREFDGRHLDEKPEENQSWTFMDLFTGIVLHDTYHTGQVQLLKRLYRSSHE